jgi:hypothetical protein
MTEAHDIEEFDDDINTTAPQDKPATTWTMPAPVFRKTSGRLPKAFENRLEKVDAVQPDLERDPTSTADTEPKPKSHTLKIVVVALALAAMIAFLVVFLTVVYFFFLRASSGD